MNREDRELQIKLAELQIKQQHVASLFTVIIAIEFSVLTSYVALFFTLKQSGEFLVVSNVIIALAGTLVLIPITLWLYLKLLKRLDIKIENLKKEYLW